MQESWPVKFWEFKYCPPGDKVQLCWDEGTYLGQRENKKYDIFLYDYRGLYFIELYGFKNSDRISHATALRTLTSRKLEKYAQLISISDLWM